MSTPFGEFLRFSGNSADWLDNWVGGPHNEGMTQDSASNWVFANGYAGQGSVVHFAVSSTGNFNARCGADNTNRYTVRNNRSRSFSYFAASDKDEAVAKTTCKKCLKAAQALS